MPGTPLDCKAFLWTGEKGPAPGPLGFQGQLWLKMGRNPQEVIFGHLFARWSLGVLNPNNNNNAIYKVLFNKTQSTVQWKGINKTIYKVHQKKTDKI